MRVSKRGRFALRSKRSIPNRSSLHQTTNHSIASSQLSRGDLQLGPGVALILGNSAPRGQHLLSSYWWNRHLRSGSVLFDQNWKQKLEWKKGNTREDDFGGGRGIKTMPVQPGDDFMEVEVTTYKSSCDNRKNTCS